MAEMIKYPVRHDPVQPSAEQNTDRNHRQQPGRQQDGIAVDQIKFVIEWQLGQIDDKEIDAHRANKALTRQRVRKQENLDRDTA